MHMEMGDKYSVLQKMVQNIFDKHLAVQGELLTSNFYIILIIVIKIIEQLSFQNN